MDLLQIAERFGIPFAVLVAVGYATWRGARWFGVEVAKPLTERHLKFLDAQEQCLDKMCDTLSAVESTQRQIVDVQKEHLAICRGHDKAPGSA